MCSLIMLRFFMVSVYYTIFSRLPKSIKHVSCVCKLTQACFCLHFRHFFSCGHILSSVNLNLTMRLNRQVRFSYIILCVKRWDRVYGFPFNNFKRNSQMKFGNNIYSVVHTHVHWTWTDGRRPVQRPWRQCDARGTSL